MALFQPRGAEIKPLCTQSRVIPEPPSSVSLDCFHLTLNSEPAQTHTNTHYSPFQTSICTVLPWIILSFINVYSQCDTSIHCKSILITSGSSSSDSLFFSVDFALILWDLICSFLGITIKFNKFQMTFSYLWLVDRHHPWWFLEYVPFRLSNVVWNALEKY